MAKTRVLGRMFRGLLALSVAALYACSDGDDSSLPVGGGSATPLNWNSTTSPTGGQGGGLVKPLNWIDPNLGPIGGGGSGGGGDLTYGQADPMTYPPGDPLAGIPVCSAAPQSAAAAAEESNLEGRALAYYASLFTVNQGGGGGGFGQVPVIPGFYSNPKIQTVARARSKAMVMGAANVPQLPARLTLCAVNFIPPTTPAGAPADSHASGAGMTYVQAWNSMSGPVQAFISAPRSISFFGAGYWDDGAGNNHFDMIWLETSSGQVP